MIEICNGVVICRDTLEFRFSPSSGPGGQNVNKVSTRVTVLLDVAGSKSFSAEQKKRIRSRLSTRINKDGVLRVVCQKYRTQKANRQEVVERLTELLNCALKRKPVRKKTKIPYAAKRKRIQEKKRRSILKRQRDKVGFQQD